MLRLSVFIFLTILISQSIAQLPDAPVTDSMSFEEYAPISTLVVPHNEVNRARFPVIDVHSHQWNMPEQDLALLARQMDSLNLAVLVNLSGRGFVHKMGPDGKPKYLFRPRGFLKASIEAANKHWKDICSQSLH